MSPKHSPPFKGGASEEDGEHPSEEPHPPTVLEKGLVKLHLRPKERVSERRSKELVSEESSKDGGASGEDGEHCSEEPRPPTVMEKGLAKLHLRPKERISEGRSRVCPGRELQGWWRLRRKW